eukprot:365216-Chlamydomonas_euryale.AAC.12
MAAAASTCLGDRSGAGSNTLARKARSGGKARFSSSLPYPLPSCPGHNRYPWTTSSVQRNAHGHATCNAGALSSGAGSRLRGLDARRRGSTRSGLGLGARVLQPPRSFPSSSRAHPARGPL